MSASNEPAMLPDLQSSLLCDDVRQERNGKFILIGLFDALTLARLPARYPRLFMVTRWCSGEGEFKQHSRILGPDQQTVIVAGRGIPVRLPHTAATATSVEVFVNVTFRQEGAHWVEVELDESLKLRYPLQVRIVQRPNGENKPGRPGGGFPAT